MLRKLILLSLLGLTAAGPVDDPNNFPLAVWLQDPKNAAKYQDVGINLYVGLWDGPTQQQLDAMEKVNMPVICEPNDFALHHLENKTIVGWMMGDEPDNAQQLPSGKGYGPPITPEKILQRYNEIHKADPTRPVMLNLGQGVAWDGWFGRGVRSNHPEDYPKYVQAGDIVSFDIYPVTHDRREIAGKLEYVGRGVSRLVDWTGGKKPVWACIETSHIGNPNALPTPSQVRSEVWMAIIHGARGIIYFSHEFKPKFIEAGMLSHPEIAQAVKEINAQIHDLAAVINSPDVPNLIMSNGPANMVKQQGDATYLFAVSESAHPTHGSFTITGPAEHVEVLGESRQIDITAGKFEDTFESYGVHLYRIAR